MSTVQKYLGWLVGLTAGWLVLTNAKGLATGLNAGGSFLDNTLKTASGR